MVLLFSSSWITSDECYTLNTVVECVFSLYFVQEPEDRPMFADLEKEIESVKHPEISI